MSGGAYALIVVGVVLVFLVFLFPQFGGDR